MTRTALALTLSLWIGAAAMADATAESASGWDFPTDDQVMLVEPNGRWHLQNPDGGDRTFWYGVPGDVPLLGDWDGDGVDTPGMYRPTNGFAYLSNTFPTDGAVGIGDPGLTFFFGAGGDQVFSGDWDGDGIDTLGIFHGGKVFLANTNATTIADREFWFGAPGDIAIGGDGDGDGVDSVFLYRPSTGFIFHTNSVPADPNAAAPTDGAHFFGLPGDRPVIGDWNDDRTDTAGVFRPVDTTVYLRDSHTTGPADELTVFGEPAWTPVAGRVGDFLREVIVAPVGTEAENGVALREAAAFVTSQGPTASAPWVIQVEAGTYNVWENDGATFNHVGLELPDHSSLIGVGRDEVTITFSALWSTGIRLGIGTLEGFTFDFWDHQGTGIVLESGTLRDVHVVGIIDRGGTGVRLVSGTVINSSIEIHENGSAGVIALSVTDADVISSEIDVWGAYTFEGIAIRASGRLSVADSAIRSHGYGSAYKCVGISSTGPDLSVNNSTIEACIEIDLSPNTGSVGIRAAGGTVENSYVASTPHPIEASGPMEVSDSTLAGGGLIGAVTCQDVQDGFGFWFPNQCPGLPFLYRVNAGGSYLSDGDGGPGWAEDTENNPSQFGFIAADDPANTTAEWPLPTLDASVPTDTPLWLFKSERWDGQGGSDLHWNFPVGSQEMVEVRLYFANGYPGASDLAQRAFDVSIDDRVVLDDYDVVADVGHTVGVMKRFVVETDGDGLDITLTHLDPAVQNPFINAIAILVPEHLTVIEATGTPLQNGATLRAALATAAANAGAGEDRIIQLGPGTFEISAPLQLVPDVVVEGSGRNESVITRSLGADEPDRALILGADDAELRHVQLLAVDPGGWGSPTPVILNVDASPRIDAVDVILTGQSLTGIDTTGGSPHIRDVRVIAVDTNAHIIGFRFDNSTPRLSNLVADTSSGSSGTVVGLWASGSDFALSRSRIIGYNDGWGGTGLSVSDGTVRLEEVYAEGHGGWFSSAGASFSNSTVTIDHSTITTANHGVHSVGAAFGNSTAAVRNTLIDTTWGEPPIAVSVLGGDVLLENVTMRAFEATYGSGRGVQIRGAVGPIRVLIEDSSVSGPTWTVSNESTTEVIVRHTILAGGPVVGSGPVTCVDVTDEFGTFYPSNCPD